VEGIHQAGGVVRHGRAGVQRVLHAGRRTGRFWRHRVLGCGRCPVRSGDLDGGVTHSRQHLFNAGRIGGTALRAAGVVAAVGEVPDGLHVGGVVIGARRHAAAGVECSFDNEAVAGKLAGVDLHEAEVNGPALREQGRSPRCGLLWGCGADCGGGQATRTVSIDTDDEGIAATLMDGDGSET